MGCEFERACVTFFQACRVDERGHRNQGLRGRLEAGEKAGGVG